MLEVKIPKKIKIGGYDYKIIIDSRKDIDLRSLNWSGSQSLMQQSIQIDSSLLPQNTSQTFIHEILHAVSRTYDSNKLAEDDIEQVANGLLQVFEELGIRFVR